MNIYERRYLSRDNNKRKIINTERDFTKSIKKNHSKKRSKIC